MAILKLPRAVPALITHAQAIVASMTDNPNFPAPVPALWLVSKAVTRLENAEAAALGRISGAVAVRDEKQRRVGSLLQQLRSYVQVVADEDPGNAAAIIRSAGMLVKKEAKVPPRVFSAKPGRVPGAVEIVAPKAADRAAYDWQYSTDGGVNWLTMPSTVRASTMLSGLTSGATVMLKYRSVTSKGESAWSAAITAKAK